MICTENLRISAITPLISPALLHYYLPLNAAAASLVTRTRTEIDAIMKGNDDRLLVVIGPCSIHDPKSALEYADLLKKQAERYADELLIIMRVYFEKPRTTVGWKGLINDPHLDNSFDINHGLRTARGLLLELANRGIPAATEFLDTISPQYIADLICYGAIGARTTESQVHRELASGLSMPIGFKNGTGGSVQVALDAIQSASHSHHFLGVTQQGVSAIVSTKGNDSCHVILRGGKSGSNYDEVSIKDVEKSLIEQQLPPHVMVDCSHGNSMKNFKNQPLVANALSKQIEEGCRCIAACMIESNLIEGAQKHASDLAALTYGQSITDQCLGWEDSLDVLERLAVAVRSRR